MRKSVVALILIVLLSLMVVFSLAYFSFKLIEETDFNSVEKIDVMKTKIGDSKNLFLIMTIIAGFIFFPMALYLVFQFRRPKGMGGQKVILPLHDYLKELKDSESSLKNIVAEQQEKVTKKEELNLNIIQNINSAVIFLNLADKIEIFNPGAEEMFSQSYANAKNNTLENILKNHGEIIDFIYRSDKKSSSEVHSEKKIFLVDVLPLPQIGKLVIVREVTEEKRREEISIQNRNFIMLGEMAAFLAHEIRNSLGVIYGYTKTIQTEKEKIGDVNREIQFLTSMMQNFLDFSKPVPLKKREKVNLAQMLEKISGEKEIGVDFSGDVNEIDGDPTLFYSVMSNLVLNSLESGATKIDVTCRRDKMLEIVVKDNGTGIPEKAREKIWFPFFTTKDKGTGMGLAIVRKIIGSLNGEIKLIQSDKTGTTFKITFYD